MRKLLFILSSFFVLTACSDKEQKELQDEAAPPLENIDEPKENFENINNNGENDHSENEPEETEGDLKCYFKPADSTATFIGDGNEFASYTERTKWLAENYVATIIDNGGAVVMKVYRVLDDKIILVMDELVEGTPEDATYPDIGSLTGLPALEIYLAGPIEVGTTFGNWTIVETNMTLATPYQTFKNVLVIEETGEGFTNKKFFVEDYGVIKTESIMSLELSEEVIVTSTLENLSLH